MESKTQRNERLRKMRQKYGLGEYKNRSRSISQSKRRVNKMARKRATRRRSTSSSLTSGLMGTTLGVGGYILFEALLEPKLAQYVGNGLMLNLVELGAGAYLARKGGVVGSIGKAAVVINVYQILQPYLQSSAVQNALPF